MDTITPALESLKLKMIFWQSCVIPIEVIRQRIIPKHKIPANQKKRTVKKSLSFIKLWNETTNRLRKKEGIE